jgi:hypothetical protein
MESTDQAHVNAPVTLADALARIIGTSLSSVTFVADYVQFDFNGPGLTAFTLPTFSSGPNRLAWGEPGYRDALCEQIDRRVENVTIDDHQVSIRFEGNREISISLLDKDYVGPEALTFSFDKEKVWIV